jgi:hypothetical protein
MGTIGHCWTHHELTNSVTIKNIQMETNIKIFKWKQIVTYMASFPISFFLSL